MQTENYRLNAVIATQQEIAGMKFNLNSVMDLIARRTHELSYADGAIIEIAENDEVVIQAATGLAVTTLNSRIKIDSCITGLCLMTGQTIYCQDTELDDRVNHSLCLQLGIRSILLVPLRFSDQQIVGVLNVFSKTVDAFNEQDIHSLQLMAGLLGLTMRHIREVETANQLLMSELARHERLEEELQAALTKEKGRNQQTTKLVSQISHDLRTPLTAIQTSTELIQFYSDKFSPEKKTEIFERIHSSVFHLTTMLDEALPGIQIAAGKE